MTNIESSPMPPREKEFKRSASPPSALEDTPRAAAVADFSIPQSSRHSNQANEDLLSQLAEAKAQIQKLKQQAADNELRRRKAGGDDKKPGAAGTSLQQQQLPPQPGEVGVPLQMVAILCLISFLLAYIFF
jgi:hypothetical protein